MAVGTPVAASAVTPSAANVLTSGAIPITTGVAAGGVIWAEIVAGSASAGLAVTDSQSNTWTVLSPSIAASGSATSTTIAYCSVTTGLTTSDTVTVTRTPTGSLTVKLYTASGIDPASPINGTPGAGNSITGVTTVAAGSVTPATGDLVVELGGMGTGYGTVTPGAGYTGLTPAVDSTGGTNPRGMYSQYQLIAAGGTISPTYTISSGKAYAALAVVFKAAAAGGAGSVTVSSTTSMSTTGVAHPSLLMGPGDSLTERGGTVPAPPTREAAWRALAAGRNYPPGSVWLGLGGRSMTSLDGNGKTPVQNIADAAVSLGQIDRAVGALGTNDVGSSDATFTADLNALLTAYQTAGVGRLVYMNLAFYSAVNTNALHFNPIIAARVAAFGYTYLDWNTYIHSAGVYDPADWLASTGGDSTHMTVQGWAKRDQFILAALEGSAVLISSSTTLAVTAAVTAQLASAAGLTATGNVGRTGSAPSLSSTAALTVTGTVGAPGALTGTVSMSSTTGLSATGVVGKRDGVTMISTVGVTVGITAAGPASVILSGTAPVPTIRSGAVI